MAQLVERLLPTPEVRGSNPVKYKEESGMANFLKIADSDVCT